MISLCNKSGYHVNDDPNRYHFNSFEFLHLSEYLIILVTAIVSLAGVVANSLTIAILLNKRFEKEFKQKQYTYMVIYSVSNVLVCFIQLVSLVNECQRPAEIFCSRVRKSNVVQYFKIVFVEFFQHFLISISNCSYVAFALCRLSLVGNKPSGLVKFVWDVGVKKLITTFIIFSCLLTLAKPFRYKRNTLLHGFDEFPEFFISLNKMFTGQIKLYKLIVIADSVYDLINYCVIVLVIFVVDVVMLKRVREVMREREKKMSDQLEAKRIKVKKENEESFKKLVRFVVLNSTTNLGLKIPNSFTSLNDLRLITTNIRYLTKANYFSVYDAYTLRYPLDRLCLDYKSCLVFQSFGHFLFVVSLCVNFFFLKLFDRNFREAFGVLFAPKNKEKSHF